MGTNTSSAASVLAGLDSIREWQEELYKELHQYPELSMKEEATSQKMARLLTEFGFEVTTGIGGTGVVGVLSNGEGPTVLMRADMDGLPVKEDTGLEYASQAVYQREDGTAVPVMHACGHDSHMSSLLGAARLLCESKEAWSGTFIALFQPGEETAEGARAMVADDLKAKIPMPDAALAQHVVPARSGCVATQEGPFLSIGLSMRVTMHGRGSHGSMPHLSVDPVVMASSAVVRLQTLVAREIDPHKFSVMTVGKIEAGSKSNVISDHAVLELNIRAYDEETRDHLVEGIQRIVRAEAAASGSEREPEFETYDAFPLTDNHAAPTERVAQAFDEHFGERAIRDFGKQTASEDFSDIPNALGVPYTYWVYGGADPQTYDRAAANGTLRQDIPANHSPFFAPVLQPTLDTATEAAVVAVCAWLGKN